MFLGQVRFVAALLAASSLALFLASASAVEEDKGESPEYVALRNRATSPKPAEIDSTVTLSKLIATDEPGAFSTAKGAKITGYARQVEREPDGDAHVVLASSKGETNTTQWVIVEVPPAWQQRAASLAMSRLRKLVGQQIQVTGWLYFEPDVEEKDPRGTRWEIHPVTSIKVVATK